MNENVAVETLSETENYYVMRSRDEDGVVYHVEMGGISLHFLPEEWEEFALLIRDADK